MNVLHMPAKLQGTEEAEAGLLSAMMHHNPLIDSVADKLSPEDFSEEFYGHVFGLMVKEHSLGHAVNPITLRPYLQPDGAAVVAGLMGSSGVAVLGARGFAEQILDFAKRRRLSEGLGAVMQAAGDYDTSVADLTADVEATLAEVTRHNEGATELSAADAARRALEASSSADTGVTCGIEPLDRALGPIRKKNLAILAGRPGMGKSAVAISYGIGAAQQGMGVLMFSLEMSAEEIGERALCDVAFDQQYGPAVPYAAIVNGDMTTEQGRTLARAAQALDDLPFHIVDVGGLSVQKLALVVRRWKRRFAAKGQSLDLVIVDYLQKLRVQGQSNRFEVITEISQTLKEVAKDNDLGVLALAQLSRKVEERDDKRPQLSDLRESGQIEQDADAVLFLLRQEYYLRKAEPHPHSAERAEWESALAECHGRIEFICAKRRKGMECTTEGRFFGAYQAVRA